jgi:hypothetical protein
LEASLDSSVIIEVPGYSSDRGRLARRWLEFVSCLPDAEIAAWLSADAPPGLSQQGFAR